MRRIVLAVAVLAAAIGMTPTTSYAQPASATTVVAKHGRDTVTGPRGNRITVSQVRRLDPRGDRVVVRGRGFNETVGIYVAFCVTPRHGRVPSPCGGGVNMQGTSMGSVWVSSNPPPYGAGLAKPYKRGGRFRVAIGVRALIGTTDCRRVSCSIVTRADHTRGSDRRWDLAVPVRFR